jgi:hypothetical protein
MSIRDNLGREVDWFGVKGVIVGIYESPTYAIRFSQGRELTIGVDRVTLLPEGETPAS